MKKDTKIVNAGRASKWTRGVVNPPVERASTVVFESTKQMKHTRQQTVVIKCYFMDVEEPLRLLLFKMP